MNQRRELPDLELSCLRLLWSGAQTVHEVRDALRPSRPLAYTTVMTVLDRLVRKGVASRRKVGRAHHYHAEFPRDTARSRALDRLVDVYFDGSRESLLEYLGLGFIGTAAQEPERARALLDEPRALLDEPRALLDEPRALLDEPRALFDESLL